VRVAQMGIGGVAVEAPATTVFIGAT